MPLVRILKDDRFGEGWKRGDVVGMDWEAVRVPAENGDVEILPEEPEINDPVEIVVVLFNNPEVEKKCLEHIEKNTEYPHKITTIDNYKKKEPLSKVWRDAVRKSDCEYVCLLNNDAFVSKGWLKELMKGWQDDVAAISPSSDNVGGIQRGFTEESVKQYVGIHEEIQSFSGFCFVVRKDLPFKFTDDVPHYGGEHAWCIMAHEHGYRLLWSKGSFVAHLSQSSANKEGTTDKLRKDGQQRFVKWVAKRTPVLYTTFNRLEYTKQTLPALIKSTCGDIIVVDNGSTDGTKKYLKSLKSKKLKLIFNKKNKGVAGAMNIFFDEVKTDYAAKVDNDTLVEKDWLIPMIWCSTYRHVDILQAKHYMINLRYKDFDEWMSNLRKDPKANVYYSDFVGGSGVLMNRWKIKGEIEETEDVLGGWSRFQRYSGLTKGFCTDTEVKLLDMQGDNEIDVSQYPSYYRKTGRSKVMLPNETMNTVTTIKEIIKRLGTKFAYVRFGDGELLMLDDGEYKGKQTTHFNSPELQEELKEAFTIDDPDYLIGNSARMPYEEKAEDGLFAPPKHMQDLIDITDKYWTGKIFYTPIPLHYAFTFEKGMFDLLVEMLREYKIVFVGGEHLREIDLPVNKFIEIPKEQSYYKIEEWYPLVRQAARDNDIVIFAAAQAAKITQKRLWKEKIKVGSIDLGSVANAMVKYEHSTHSWIKKTVL